MAIQNRRGVYADFDPTKLMPGEFAVVMEDDPDGTSGAAVYMCFGNSIVKRLVGADDLQDIVTELLNIGPGSGEDSVKQNTNSATGDWSFATGYYSTSSGAASHTEGSQNLSSGNSSHSEGIGNTASGDSSHAEGRYNTAKNRSQHVFGEYAVPDNSSANIGAKGNYIEIVGNGTSSSSRSNARTLDWSGNEVLAGKLTVGAAPTADMDVATKQYVDNSIAGLSQVEFTDPNDDGNIVISFT